MDEVGRLKRELRDLILANDEKRRNFEIMQFRLNIGLSREHKLEKEIGRIASRGCAALRKTSWSNGYNVIYQCLLRENMYAGGSFREHFCSICRLRKKKDFAIRVLAIRLRQRDSHGK